jgi:hypothetical protein
LSFHRLIKIFANILLFGGISTKKL